MSDWSSLPPNSSQLVASFLRRQEIRALSQVNKHWRGAVRPALSSLSPSVLAPLVVDRFPCLTHLDLSKCWDSVNDAKIEWFVRELCHKNSLKSLSLAKCHQLTNKGIAAVVEWLPGLEKLVLAGCREPFPVPVGHMGYIGVNGDTVVGLAKLLHLDLRWNPVTDETVASLVKLTTLKNLVLGECPGITSVGVEMLSSLVNIEVLSLERTMVSVKGLQKLHGMTRIRSLSLANCSRISDEALPIVAQMTSLKTLALSRCGVSDSGVTALRALPQLTELDLSYCLQVTGACFEAFQDNPTLQTLKLCDCYECCVDNTLKVISGISSLRKIDLTNCSHLSDAGISFLSTLPLETLNLCCCATSIEGFAKISSILTLTELDISFWPNVKDHWLKKLTKLTALSFLNLSKCSGVTDKGVGFLKSLGHSLKHINCSECHRITSTSVQMISTSFPFLESLGLAWLDVQDADCTELRKLSHLQQIDLTGCPDLTLAGLQELWYVDGVFDDRKSPQQRIQ